MPYERYTTAEDVPPQHRDTPDARYGRCRVCGEVLTVEEVVGGKVITKRNGVKRHASCGGPPAPDRPVRPHSDVVAEREAKAGGKAGAKGNEQGRVIRKGNSLS